LPGSSNNLPYALVIFFFFFGLMQFDFIVQYFALENARGSPHSVLLAFSQTYVKLDLRKNKIVMAFTTGFFRH
jgi:hypothetical protein